MAVKARSHQGGGWRPESRLDVEFESISFHGFVYRLKTGEDGPLTTFNTNTTNPEDNMTNKIKLTYAQQRELMYCFLTGACEIPTRNASAAKTEYTLNNGGGNRR